MARLWSRVRALAPALGCAVLAIVLVAMATSHTELVCERATGSCRMSSGSFGMRTERRFAIADVLDVRLVDGLGKHGRQAETVLVFASGHDLRLARADREPARARFAQFRAFFAADATTPRLALASTGARWAWAAAAALLAAAGVLGVRGWRRVLPATRPAAARDPARRRRVIAIGVGLAVVVVGIQLGLLYVANQTQGWLELRCATRCRFDGIECTAGAASRMALDPGTYTIEVWTGKRTPLWEPRTFEIAVGETTTYVCAP